MKKNPLGQCSPQRGFALIEAMVSLVVLAFGVLGLIGFQMQTLRDTRDSVGRSRAIVGIQDIGDRMRINPNLVPANYTAGFGAVATPTDCTAAPCTTAQLAAFDIWRWKANIAAALPGGQAAIAPSPSDPRQFAVMVGWLENKSDALASDAADRTVNKGTAIGGIAVNGMLCPVGLTCHLVYVQPFL
ncbi:MAG: type IV pilus modification protein PilV [Burkholderiales bacterium RIFCSPLOWO2_02_FULL_57_36]|nr:MAG: type IV pilus modification protein PilV [Burkholderiales bacterium RIFCSPLOWO2_02_FULL_57_36]